jgi:hypothetical protein
VDIQHDFEVDKVFDQTEAGYDVEAFAGPEVADVTLVKNCIRDSD